jgi:hypothetical protein
MSPIRSRWRVLSTLLAVLSLALISLVPSLSLAQSSPAPAGHAQVIAQGVDLMPRTQVAWRVTESTARPADEAGFFDRSLGFAIGTEDPILVTDGDSGTHTLLGEGQASFHPEGANERRSSATSRDAAYLNIELVVADEVDTDDSLGSADLLFAGDGFRAPRGHHDLRLTRDVLAPEEEGTFEATDDSPYLLYVTDGAIQVTGDGNDITELAAGDAIELTGDIEILAGANAGGAWLIASIGDEVEIPPPPTSEAADTGSLEIRLETCPSGFDAECEPTTNEEVTVPAFHLVDGDNWIIPDRAEVSDDETVYTYADLPAGDYTTGPEAGIMLNVQIDGAEWSDDNEGWDFGIEPGEKTVLRLQVIPQAQTGSFFVTLYDCPAGTSPDDLSACETTTDPRDIVLENVDTGEAWSTFSDAEAESDAQYFFPALPAGAYVLSGIDPDDLYDVYFTGNVSLGNGEPLVAIEPDADHSLFVYYVPTERAPEGPTDEPAVGSGSLVITQFDCPYGTDVSVDASACAVTAAPWDVTVTNDATGESWSLLVDGAAWDSGTYVLEGLPEGDYSVSVPASGDWDLSYSSSTYVSAGYETYETVYSVDRRVP